MDIFWHAPLGEAKGCTVRSARAQIHVFKMPPMLSGWSWHGHGADRVLKLGRWEIVLSPAPVDASAIEVLAVTHKAPICAATTGLALAAVTAPWVTVAMIWMLLAR